MEYDPLSASSQSPSPESSEHDTRPPRQPSSGAPGLPPPLESSGPFQDPLAPRLARSSGSAGGGKPADGGNGGSDDGGPPRRQGVKRRLFVLYPLIAALLAAVTGVVVAASIRRPQVDSLDDFVPRLVTRLFDRSSQEFMTYSRENRVLLADGEVPQVLEDAILSVEDSNFYNHGGVDLKGILRAVVTNLRERRIAEGASTITMQLARELFQLSREQNYQRKIEEAFLAVELEKKFSKQQILTMYCNMVNLSQGNYGMEAAARNYFNKSVADLTLAEAATLAGIPQRPTAHNPYRYPEVVTQRRNVVLGRMLAEEKITQEEHEAAVAEPLLVAPRRAERTLGPYYSEEVRRYLIETYGETELYDRGLQIHTTLDRDIQRAAETALHNELVNLDHSKGWRGAPKSLDLEGLVDASLPSWRGREILPGEWYEGIVLESDRRMARVKIAETIYELDAKGIAWTRRSRPEQVLSKGDVAYFRLEPLPDDGKGEPTLRLMLEQEPEIEGAALVLESSTGAVRAMVGGLDFERNEFNRVTQAQRQVGSAFKPFVFGAALEIGFTAADTLFDGPVVFAGADNKESYSPRNFHRSYNGIITLRSALERSINVPAVKLLDMVGVEQVIDFARRCGIESELPPYPSLALGSADLTPMEMAAAYATFANRGIYVEPYLIEKITNRNGRLVEEHLPQAHKAMEPGVAYVLVSMLRGVATRGTGAGRLARIDAATAGKTGTTNAFTDAWFVGFTPRYTILTWVGYDQKRFLGRGWTGAHAALPIWASIVRQGLEDGWLSSDETFTPPPGMVERDIEPTSGLLFGPGAERTVSEVFIEGTEPVKRFDRQWARIVRLPWYLQEPFYIAKEGERMPSQVDDWSTILETWEEKEKRASGGR